MTQFTMFPIPVQADPPPPHSGSPTSRAAAAAIADKAASLRALVLATIRKAGKRGATDGEVYAALGGDGIRADTLRARRWELQRAGEVADSGKRRKTASGRQAIVWVCVEVAK